MADQSRYTVQKLTNGEWVDLTDHDADDYDYVFCVAMDLCVESKTFRCRPWDRERKTSVRW